MVSASHQHACHILAKRAAELGRPGQVIAFRMKAWKHPFLQEFFPHKRFHFVPFQLTRGHFLSKVLPLLEAEGKPSVMVWSNDLPDFVAREIARLGLVTYFVEDGFIRSLEAHAGYSVPLSLSLDSSRPYFDSRGKSDLEEILLHYDFENDVDLIQRARRGIKTILEHRLTKYNGSHVEPNTLTSQVGQRRKQVLIIGQVEEDASIRYGCDRSFTNNDLVRLAAKENPHADITYKPHPDVLSRIRREVSNPNDVAHLCKILKGGMSLADALDAAEHVYTITSLAGFEALMRGKKVTTIGAPFYSGWGLTDDRQLTPRRVRSMSVEAIFAAAYILYPIYFVPATGSATSFEETINSLTTPETSPRLSLARGVKWQLYGTYGILGWRHMLTPIISKVVARIGNDRDAMQYRSNPAGFFKELTGPVYKVLGRILYPWS